MKISTIYGIIPFGIVIGVITGLSDATGTTATLLGLLSTFIGGGLLALFKKAQVRMVKVLIAVMGFFSIGVLVGLFPGLTIKLIYRAHSDAQYREHIEWIAKITEKMSPVAAEAVWTNQASTKRQIAPQAILQHAPAETIDAALESELSPFIGDDNQKNLTEAEIESLRQFRTILVLRSDKNYINYLNVTISPIIKDKFANTAVEMNFRKHLKGIPR